MADLCKQCARATWGEDIGALAGLSTPADTEAGRYPLVYFGYTSCPDVCPTDMAAVGQAMRSFEKIDPARAAKIQPIFVTVDPARDTPPVLKQFVRAFHPRMIGLTGTEVQVAAVAKEYAVVFRRNPPVPGVEGYLVDHSRMVTLFGPKGEPLALVPADEGGRASVKVLEQWVR